MAHAKVKKIYDNNPNVIEAAKALEQAAKADNELREYLLSPYLSKACYDAVRKCSQSERKIIWTAPNYTKSGNGHRVKEHAISLLDFPLPNGMRIRFANKQDVLDASDFYDKQAADMRAKQKWLSRVADKLEGKRTVGQTFSAEQLEALK